MICSVKSDIDLRVEQPERVLAICLTYRGFGYVIFDNPSFVFDWGHCSVDQHDPNVFRERITKLMTTNAVDRLLIYQEKNRPTRIQRNILSLGPICKSLGIQLEKISKDQISEVFESFGSYTKYQRAGIVASYLPELSYKLPPQRKPWMSEDLRMSIFDSACLALAYYYLKK